MNEIGNQTLYECFVASATASMLLVNSIQIPSDLSCDSQFVNFEYTEEVIGAAFRIPEKSSTFSHLCKSALTINVFMIEQTWFQ